MQMAEQRLVYLSYARPEHPFADTIAQRIEKVGRYQVVRDDLLLGADLIEETKRQLQSADTVILLMSEAAEQSRFVGHEIALALREKQRIIPVLLDARGKFNSLMSLVGDRQILEAVDLSPDEVAKRVNETLSTIDSPPMAAPAVWPRLLLFVIVTLLVSLTWLFIKSLPSGTLNDIARQEAELRHEAEKIEQRKIAAENLEKNVRAKEEANRLLIEGMENAKTGRLTPAIKLYTESVELNPDAATFQLIGYAHLRRSQLTPGAHPMDKADAITFLEKSIKMDPNYVWGYYNLALAFAADGDMAKAQESLQTLLKLDSSFAETIRGDGQFSRLRKSPEIRRILDKYKSVK